jgi:2-phosphosulfolactate phosphatase
VNPYAQEAYAARFDWGEAATRELAPRAGVVVIVDVLRFSTAVDVAVSRGAAVAPVEGGGASLSPVELLSVTAGARLELDSFNGSVLSRLAVASGPTHIVAGCLRNASAVAAWCRAQDGPVLVVAAGERWMADHTLRPCVEDLIGAGAVLAALNAVARSPEAEAAVAAYERHRPRLSEVLHTCASGLELMGKGLAADIPMAADVDVSDAVPVLVDGAFVHEPLP